MKIGIDFFAAAGGGGNAAYSRNLILALGDIDKENQYHLFSYTHDVILGRIRAQTKQKNMFPRAAYLSSLGLPISPSFLGNFNRFYLRHAVNNSSLDVMHYTNPLDFVEVDVPTVVTIHDLSALHQKQWAKQGTRELFISLLQGILSSTHKIIAVSQYTKDDLIRTLNVDSKKIEVIYEAASADYFPECKPEFLESHFGIKKYFIYVGQLQPRKNLHNLIKAFSKIAKLDSRLALVLVGESRNTEYLNSLRETILSYDVENRVILLGYVPDHTLRKLYSSALALVYPSFFEGFGLPIVEALQCETPVIASKTTSLPEVVGEAGLLFDPSDIDDIAKTMERLIQGESLREQLKNRAILQAKKFSWESTAEKTLEVYKQCVTS